MNDQPGPPVPNDPRVDAALREYLECIDRDEPVDREEYLVRHALIADQLRPFIAALKNLTFTPTIGYSGPASIGLSYTDGGNSLTAPATISVTVVPRARQALVRQLQVLKSAGHLSLQRVQATTISRTRKLNGWESSLQLRYPANKLYPRSPRPRDHRKGAVFIAPSPPAGR